MSHIEIRSMSQCTMEQMVKLWNEGFQRDGVEPFRFTAYHRLRRMGSVGIDPDLSVAAFVDGQPAGFVLLARKEHDADIRRAWNGGTGVMPAYRGQGLSKLLLAEALQRAARAGIEQVSLEAEVGNDPAVRAYERCGFVKRDRLQIWLRPEKRGSFRLPLERPLPYELMWAAPERIDALPFHRLDCIPWTCQWDMAVGARSLLATNTDGTVIGYALVRHQVSASGALQMIELLQCARASNYKDDEALLHLLLGHLFQQQVTALNRRATYMPESDPILARVLERAGFERGKQEHLMHCTLAYMHTEAATAGREKTCSKSNIGK